jgi:uncharacterized membrane protein
VDPEAAGSRRFCSIDVPGADATNAFGISPGGDIVGNYQAGGVSHGFLLRGGKFTTVDVPGATLTFVNGINARGDLVGRYDSAGQRHAFLRSEGVITTIDSPDPAFTAALDINSRGDVVGRYGPDKTEHGFLWSGGRFTPVDFPGASATEADSISPSGDIVGRFTDASGVFHGYLLRGGEFTTIDHPGAVQVAQLGTVANGMNARGDVVGRYDVPGVGPNSPPPVGHGYLLSGGEFTTIDYPGATFSAATRINPSGDVTGRYMNADGKPHGFLWTRGACP